MIKKKVLILTYYWPPAGGAGVQRWLKFVKYLSQMGIEAHVYTASNPEAPAFDESLLKDIPEGTIVIKKPIWEPFGVYKKLTGKKGNFNAGFLSEEKKNKKSWSEKLSLFVRANLFIPDAKMFWIRPSVKFLSSYIAKEKIEIIISSGPPHSLHIIAQKLKRKFNIKWIADFRDPWTNIDFYQELPMMNFVDSLQHQLEKKVLSEADQVIVVGNQMKLEFEAIQPNVKIEVITNGYDSEPRTNNTLEEKFTLLHVGSVNADRSHESFYKALSHFFLKTPEAKKHFILKLVGKVDAKAREFILSYKLDSITEFVNYLPYEELSSIQEKAHLLYLPLNNTPNAKGILTGKFFEYLAARRNILVQGPIDGDVATILQNTIAGKVFHFDDYEGITKFLEKNYQDYLNHIYRFQSIHIEQYHRKTLSQNLAEIIKKIGN